MPNNVPKKVGGDNWQAAFESAVNGANAKNANYPKFHESIHKKAVAWAQSIMALQANVDSIGGMAVQDNLGITPELDQMFNCLATFLTTAGVDETSDATPDTPIFLSLGIIQSDNAMAIMLGYLLAVAVARGDVKL